MPGYDIAFEPDSFSLDPDATQQITITASISDVTLPADLAYSRVWFSESGGLSPDQQLPLTVRGDARTVECASGYCSLRLDAFSAGYSAVGCGVQPCSMVWANRYSAALNAFPITLTSITFLTGSSSYVTAGDTYDFHVYQDDDRDPTNGATLAGSHTGYVVPAAGTALRTVLLDTPIVVDGPGDIVIALTRPTGTGPKPAAGELSEYKARSYVGHFDGSVPDLGSDDVDLQLTSAGVGSEVNWVIRAFGTAADGKAIQFGGNVVQ